MSNFEGHSVPFIIGWMVQDMRGEVYDNMAHDTETDIWSVDVDIVEKHIAKIMDYILNLPTEVQERETWNGIHAQITAPKGTFERIVNDTDDDDDDDEI